MEVLSISHNILNVSEQSYQQFLKKEDYFKHFLITFQLSFDLRRGNFRIDYEKKTDKKQKWFRFFQFFLFFKLDTNDKILYAFWLMMGSFIYSYFQYQKLTHLNSLIQYGNLSLLK